MENSVIISLIGSLTTLAAAMIAGHNVIKAKRTEFELEQMKSVQKAVVKQNKRLVASLSCLEIMYDAHFVAFLNDKVDFLFKNTKAERFIILFAVNGKEDFNFVSVCYEKTKTDKTRGSIYRYVRLRVDDHYRRMLKAVERETSIYIDVERMEPSLLKNIYQSVVEGVTFSSVHFIRRLQADEDNDIVVYSSLATTGKEDFTPTGKTLIQGVYDQIRARAHTITFKTLNHEDV